MSVVSRPAQITGNANRDLRDSWPASQKERTASISMTGWGWKVQGIIFVSAKFTGHKNSTYRTLRVTPNPTPYSGVLCRVFRLRGGLDLSEVSASGQFWMLYLRILKMCICFGSAILFPGAYPKDIQWWLKKKKKKLRVWSYLSWPRTYSGFMESGVHTT